jgi:hypothetical protein
VVWEHGRLAFERLQQRLARRGSGAAEGAGRWLAHYVVFDLVHADATDLTGWPHAARHPQVGRGGPPPPRQRLTARPWCEPLTWGTGTL